MFMLVVCFQPESPMGLIYSTYAAGLLNNPYEQVVYCI